MSIGHKKELQCHRGRNRCARARTFDTEAKAKAWAEAKGIKKFKLARPREGLSKKIVIISE